LKKTKDILFIRYGGLSPLKQDHYLPHGHPEKTFHNPPKKRGLYAMIKGYEELFLLGATSNPNHISGKTKWLKDDDGNFVIDDRTYDGDSKVNYGAQYTSELKKLLKKRGIGERQLQSTRQPHTKPPECPTEDTECKDCPIHKECQDAHIHYLTVLKKPRIFEYKGELWHHLSDEVDHWEVLERCGDWIKTTYDVFVKAFSKHKHLIMKDAHSNDWYPKREYNERLHDPYKRTFGITYNRDHLEVFIEKL